MFFSHCNHFSPLQFHSLTHSISMYHSFSSYLNFFFLLILPQNFHLFTFILNAYLNILFFHIFIALININSYPVQNEKCLLARDVLNSCCGMQWNLLCHLFWVAVLYCHSSFIAVLLFGFSFYFHFVWHIKSKSVFKIKKKMKTLSNGDGNSDSL